MKRVHYLGACLTSVLVALLIFALSHEYIIINYGSKITAQEIDAIAYKKNVTLYLYTSNMSYNEEIPLLTTSDLTHTIEQLISQWLSYAIQQKAIKKIRLQHAVLSFNGTELFLSFDACLWDNQASTFERWMIIESILKTVHTYQSSIKKVRFLIDDQILSDRYLDFTNAWPIEGFM
jgi:hypothetical protein